MLISQNILTGASTKPAQQSLEMCVLVLKSEQFLPPERTVGSQKTIEI
jgi:hypothetical protein